MEAAGKRELREDESWRRFTCTIATDMHVACIESDVVAFCTLQTKRHSACLFDVVVLCLCVFNICACSMCVCGQHENKVHHDNMHTSDIHTHTASLCTKRMHVTPQLLPLPLPFFRQLNFPALFSPLASL